MIEAAMVRVARYVRRTPVLDVAYDDDRTCTLKLEQLQVTGSFKPRGMFNRILTAEVPAAGLVIASGGNAGLAAAYAARELGHPIEVFVPEGAPATKVERLRAYGAHVTRHGATYADALEASAHHASATEALVVHAYDQPDVVAGQGTVGFELAEQAPDLDTLLVGVGGGGLIAGIAWWFQGRVRVIGVEPEGSPTMAAAIEAGEPVAIEAGGVAADSLGARMVGDHAWRAVQAGHIAQSLVISGQAITEARQWLWREARVGAELGGAAATGALLSGAYIPAAGERVGVVVCGANTDPSDLA